MKLLLIMLFLFSGNQLFAQIRGNTLPEYRPAQYNHRRQKDPAPYQTAQYQKVRYPSTKEWFERVLAIDSKFVQDRWIFYPALGYTNGFWPIDSYPFYVYNGLRFRYSRIDSCDYELIDRSQLQLIESYPNEICQVGFDRCSKERDQLNEMVSDYRYFCAESLTE